MIIKSHNENGTYWELSRKHEQRPSLGRCWLRLSAKKRPYSWRLTGHIALFHRPSGPERSRMDLLAVRRKGQSVGQNEIRERVAGFHGQNDKQQKCSCKEHCKTDTEIIIMWHESTTPVTDCGQLTRSHMQAHTCRVSASDGRSRLNSTHTKKIKVTAIRSTIFLTSCTQTKLSKNIAQEGLWANALFW